MRRARSQTAKKYRTLNWSGIGGEWREVNISHNGLLRNGRHGEQKTKAGGDDAGTPRRTVLGFGESRDLGPPQAPPGCVWLQCRALGLGWVRREHRLSPPRGWPSWNGVRLLSYPNVGAGVGVPRLGALKTARFQDPFQNPLPLPKLFQTSLCHALSFFSIDTMR